MKLLLSFLFLYSIVLADDIQRLESIVKDIEELRINYDNSQENLKECRLKLSDQIQKNKLIKSELSTGTAGSVKSVQKEIIYLEKQIKDLKKSILLKDKEIQLLKEKQSNNLKNKIKNEKKYKISTNQNDEEKLLHQIKAATYRTDRKSEIYDSIKGKVINTWESGTSFTSSARTKNWIKITGYFVDRKWQKTKIEMWIKADYAFKRD